MKAFRVAADDFEIRLARILIAVAERRAREATKKAA